MVDFQRQLTFKTTNVRPGVRAGIAQKARKDATSDEGVCLNNLAAQLHSFSGFFIFGFFQNIFGWGGKALPEPSPPLHGRSPHLIEAAKRGRLDQMIFFSALLTTRAPPTTVRWPSNDCPPAVRQPSTVPMVLRYFLFLPDAIIVDTTDF